MGDYGASIFGGMMGGGGGEKKNPDPTGLQTDIEGKFKEGRDKIEEMLPPLLKGDMMPDNSMSFFASALGKNPPPMQQPMQGQGETTNLVSSLYSVLNKAKRKQQEIDKEGEQ